MPEVEINITDDQKGNRQSVEATAEINLDLPHSAGNVCIRAFGHSTADAEASLTEKIERFRNEARQGADQALAYTRRVDVSKLVAKARVAKENAYATSSGYSVGAALLTEQGVYTGANIEVGGRTTSVHAEMVAVFDAVKNDARDFRMLAVSTQDQDASHAPCGLCQHTLSEFCADLRIIEDGGQDPHEEYSLSNLIGPAFSGQTR